jgi:hypothetical protein
MEFEEMKSLWGEMSADIEKQKKLTGTLIISMTQVNYRNKLNKIIIPEAVSALGCFATVIVIGVNLEKLDTWYMLVCGIVSALILLILPVLSISAVYRMNAINLATHTYQQILSAYAKGKLQFVFAQKLSFYLGAVLLLTILPVMAELIGGNDPFKKTGIWFVYVIIYPFFYGFARWVFKKYMKVTADAEHLLKELAS